MTKKKGKKKVSSPPSACTPFATDPRYHGLLCLQGGFASLSMQMSLLCLTACLLQGVNLMGGTKPPKLKVEDDDKTYIQRRASH